MIKKRDFLFYLFSITLILPYQVCHSSAADKPKELAEIQTRAMEIVDTVNKENATKKSVIKIIAKLKEGSPLAQNILKHSLAEERGFSLSSSSSQTIIERILFPKKASGCSSKDRFKIAKALWRKDPNMTLLELKVKSSASQEEEPFLYQFLTNEYMFANTKDKDKDKDDETSSFFSFICKEVLKKESLKKKFLAMKGSGGETCLHILCKLSSVTNPNNAENPNYEKLKALINEHFELLLEIGFDVNKENLMKQTPLTLSISSKSLCLVEKLLQKGAVINNLEPLQNTLHDLKYSSKLITLFLEHHKSNLFTQANILSLKTSNSQGVLHIFAQEGNKEGLELLTKKRINCADPALNQKDNFGKTPQQYAQDLADETIRNTVLTLLATPLAQPSAQPPVQPTIQQDDIVGNDQALTSQTKQSKSTLNTPLKSKQSPSQHHLSGEGTPNSSTNKTLSSRAQGSPEGSSQTGGTQSYKTPLKVAGIAAAAVILIGGALWLARKLSSPGKKNQHENMQAEAK